MSDVSIEVAEGSIFGLLGPNGAGKTTLIRLINRILLPDSGTIRIDGQPITDNDVNKIGYMPEERGLYKKMKAGEQAMYLTQLKGLSRSEAQKRLLGWFERLGMSMWWDKPVEELSKGMQQKVQFVVTVAHQPRLLILDEPFSGFDPVNTETLKQEIMSLRDNGTTVIISTHNMASVEEMCDEIALIDHSRVVLSGNVRTIRRANSTNTYRCTIESDAAPELPDSIKIEKHTTSGNEHTLQVSLPSGMDANSLLGVLTQQGTVREFCEQLPTMNDIFIQTVKQ